MAIKGSLPKSAATLYLDIVILIIGDLTNRLVDMTISRYGEPAMSNYIENPIETILVLVYQDGLAMDLEFRNSVTKDKLAYLKESSGKKI